MPTRSITQKVPPAKEGEYYTVDHTAFIYLMDRDGNYLGFFPPGTSADRMVEIIRPRLAGDPFDEIKHQRIRDLGHRATPFIEPLERDDFSSNRYPALSPYLSMIFSENRHPLFRIML